MFASKQLEELAKKLYAALPTGVKTIEHDIQQQFKDILLATFSRMDLVTREEFDVQVKVLARTREKIDALQLQIDTLVKKQ